MPAVKRICKVCGKVYESCRTQNTTGAFRWQDVACCKEHGEQYLAQLMQARKNQG